MRRKYGVGGRVRTKYEEGRLLGNRRRGMRVISVFRLRFMNVLLIVNYERI